VSIQPAYFFHLLRYDQLDSLCMQSGPTPELTGRQSPEQAFNLANEKQAISAPVE
jgi:hypothetical protein